MMTLIRFGLVILALFLLVVIWSPVLARGFWPYSVEVPQVEKLVTQRREVKGVVWTAYLIFVLANGFAATYFVPGSVNTLRLIYWIAMDLLALLIVVSFHLTQKQRRKLYERALEQPNL